MPEAVKRGDGISAFKPELLLFDEVIEEARNASSPEVIRTGVPLLDRDSHIHRLSGTSRWMLVADGLVKRSHRFPSDFSVASTDDQHNCGQYVFRCPGGVFTVK